MINILAVDDDFDFHEILKIKLPSAEFNLVLACSEKEFFEKIESKKFDLFLLDLSLDNHPLRGLEILIKLRQDNFKEIPIIVLSNTSSKKIVANALELGANDFISKPIDGKLLVSKMRSLVEENKSFSKELEFGSIPKLASEVIITSKLHLVAITEVGFLAKGSAYVAKGAKVKLRSSHFHEIFGLDKIEVYSTGFHSEISGVYMTTFEIDPDNKKSMNKAKMWIKEKRMDPNNR